MDKVYREMLDVIRAEVAELYRLRRADAARLCRLERSARRGTVARHRDIDITGLQPSSGDPDKTHV